MRWPSTRGMPLSGRAGFIRSPHEAPGTRRRHSSGERSEITKLYVGVGATTTTSAFHGRCWTTIHSRINTVVVYARGTIRSRARCRRAVDGSTRSSGRLPRHGVAVDSIKTSATTTAAVRARARDRESSRRRTQGARSLLLGWHTRREKGLYGAQVLLRHTRSRDPIVAQSTWIRGGRGSGRPTRRGHTRS